MTSIRVCKVKNCQNDIEAKGLCNKHYQRFMRNGTTNAIRVRRQENLRSCIIPDCNHKTRRGDLCGYHFTQQRHYEMKLKAVEYKGGKCCICGYNNSTRALAFHHREPENKFKAISTMIAERKYSWEEIQIELDKCDIMCSNCHAEEEEKKYGIC